MEEASTFAPLTAALIRRARADPPAAPRPPRVRALGEDARLFLLAWAAGFLFFLIFLG